MSQTDVCPESLPTGSEPTRLTLACSCSRSAWFGALYYLLVTTCAQVILTMRFNILHRFSNNPSLIPHYPRAYAITRKNKWVAGILIAVAAPKFCVGMFNTIRSALAPGWYF